MTTAGVLGSKIAVARHAQTAGLFPGIRCRYALQAQRRDTANRSESRAPGPMPNDCVVPALKARNATPPTANPRKKADPGRPLSNLVRRQLAATAGKRLTTRRVVATAGAPNRLAMMVDHGLGSVGRPDAEAQRGKRDKNQLLHSGLMFLQSEAGR
jgi:hypothetical protein